MYHCQCIANVSWMYYVSNSHVSLMYCGCIGCCTLHLCFPPYSAHHLFGAQPMRASSFGHQQPMGLAPGGWGRPWHGSTRHAFWPAGHGCSSMPCWVLSSRINPWVGIHMGPLHSMHQAWHTGLLWGGQTGPKREWKVSAKYICAVFTMYFICNPDVLTMYFERIGCVLTGKFDVLVYYAPGYAPG